VGEFYQESEGGFDRHRGGHGDYDGDGRPDIFVVSRRESCRLFRNLGGWKFEDVTAKAGVGDQGAAAGIWKQGVTFADVNNDGRLDLYVCRFAAEPALYQPRRRTSRSRRTPSGSISRIQASWRPSATMTATGCSMFNRNQHPRHRQASQRPARYLLHNNRDGTFTNVTTAAGISGETQSHPPPGGLRQTTAGPTSTSRTITGAGQLYHNNRDGTFTNTFIAHCRTPRFIPWARDLGDVNQRRPHRFSRRRHGRNHPPKDQRGVADARAERGAG